MGKMYCTLGNSQLASYVSRQLNRFFPDDTPVVDEDLAPLMSEVSQRLDYCFSHIDNDYFFDGEQVIFNHLHGDQYAMFLYLLSRESYLAGADHKLPEKLYLLNKSLHAIDVYYEIELPSVFLFVHPVGTVLGRAIYSDYLIVYQRCGVGSNHDIYPELGRFLTMHPGSTILGRCQVGDNVSLGAESLLIDENVESNSVYLGGPRDNLVRRKMDLPLIWRNVANHDGQEIMS